MGPHTSLARGNAVHYDPAHAELEEVHDRLETMRRHRLDLDPGSDEDLDGYVVIRDLETEFRDRLRMTGSRTVGVRPRRPHFTR